jgi:hypothetical protein
VVDVVSEGSGGGAGESLGRSGRGGEGIGTQAGEKL